MFHSLLQDFFLYFRNLYFNTTNQHHHPSGGRCPELSFSNYTLNYLESDFNRVRPLDYKESWVLKNWCFWTVVLEKTLESPLDGKEIKPVQPKGNQPWIFIGRTDAEAEAPVLWPLDVKNWLTGKDPDAEKDWRQEEKGTMEDEMVGWHHRLNGHEFEQPLGVGDGQGSLACCSLWGHKESEWLNNWTELNWHEQLNWTDISNNDKCSSS